MKFAFISGCLTMLLAVAIGAFGAHGLKGKLASLGTAETFETAVKYHFYHALGLFAIAWASTQWQTVNFSSVTWLLLSGIVIFSGSLYILSVTGIKWLGAITPIGGLCFIIAWALTAYKVYNT